MRTTRVRRPMGALLALLLVPVAAAAQDSVVGAVVEQIAGMNLYLSAGEEQGVQTLDTLLVGRSREGEFQALLVVVSATRQRSVVSFVGGAFPVTRGDSLYLAVNHGFIPATAAVPASRRRTQRRSSAPPYATGRVSLDLSGLHSVTKGLGSSPEVRERSFATPVARLQLAIENLPAGMTLNTSIRAAGRYSTDDVVYPTQSVRIYAASLDRTGDIVQFRLGRFYSPYDSYSGYWDGGLLRLGGRRFGIGVAGGFQPERSNEMFSTAMQKLTGFANLRFAGRSAGYTSDISLHFLKPESLYRKHTFVGWSQSLYAGPIDMSQRLQVDRDPLTDKWVVTNLQLRASARVTRGVRFYAQAARRQPYIMERIDDVLGFRRDEADAGIAFSGRAGSINVEVTANKLQETGVTWAYGGAFNLPSTSIWGLGFGAAARYGNLGTLQTLYINPGITRSFGAVQTRATYQLYRTHTSVATVLTHAGDVALTFPLVNRMFGSVRARGQWGSNLTSTALYTSLWMSF